MSSSGRTTSKGGKGAKVEKTHKTDGKPDTKKGAGDKIHNKENQVSKNDELSIKEKVKQIMDLTHRTEDEVCLALHENDNDITLAINFLFEEITTGEWETKDKKKKKRQASAGKQDKKNNDESGGGNDDWEDVLPPVTNNSGGGDGKEWKERGGRREGDQRGGRGGPPRGRGGWRDDGGSNRGGDRRGGGRGGGSTRGGGFGGRGRGGGRGGRYPPRGGRGGTGGGRDYNRQPIDTWDNSNTWDNSTAATTNHNTAPVADDWDDVVTDEWSTEEYTGSLVETKVFTPSTAQQDGGGGGGPQSEQPPQQTAAPNNIDHNLSAGSSQLDANTYSQSLSQSYHQSAPAQQQGTSPVPAAAAAASMVGRLTDAQTQYFSQLSQQNNDALTKQYGGAYQAQTQNSAYDGANANVQQAYNTSAQTYAPVTQSYSASAQQQQSAYASGVQPAYAQGGQQYASAAQNYSSAAATVPQQQTGYGPYGQQDVVGQATTQPQRAKQRARVPPPSKIPASAVEMPGDLNSSITYLDVQFGAMDLMDSSYESNPASEAKYGTDATRTSTGLDGTSRTTPTSGLDLNSSGATGASQNAMDAVYNASTKNGTQGSISSALSQALSSDSIPQQSSEHLGYNSGNKAQSQGATSGAVATVTTPSSLELSKQASDPHSSYNSQASYNSYQSKSNNYGASAYGTTQTTASSYVNPSATSYQQVAGYASQNSAPTQQNAAYAAANAQAAAYQNANSYPAQQQQQSYASSAQGQTAYGANTGLTNNSNYASSGQYNSYNSSGGSGKLGNKEYDNSASNTTGSATSSTTSNNAVSQSATVSSSKSTATLAKNTTSVMSNIPPGVAAPVMSTPYIMGQMPYFQQPVYSYEDVQMLQQRLPHMPSYYDMGYQTPTTLAAVRGDPTVAAALGGYPATPADGRFQAGGRAADGTTSPQPNAASQQQQQQQQPQQILATPGAAQPYFFTAFNTLGAPPNYPQFGAMYTTQLPAVTNAHGSSANSQYGPKPGTYGSAAGYGGYDALGQSAAAQDYAKGGYTAAAAAAVQQAAAQKGGQGNSTAAGSVANDLTAAMYGKSHAALGKVNSYEKQGFHSGTPPPFTGALSQSAGTGYAPAQVYIPTMPQHHSTMAMHQPLHQMDVRHQGRRADSGNSSSQRSQGSNQSKSGSKQGGYGAASYWNQN